MARKLTPKQKGFADDYLDTKNATESAARNYNVSSRSTARAIGSENLTKPDIKAYIADKASDAISMIYKLSQTAENEGVRYNASRDIVDRAGFKATDNIDVKSDGKPLPTQILIIKPNQDVPKDTEQITDSPSSLQE